jgi:hypothetical protein
MQGGGLMNQTLHGGAHVNSNYLAMAAQGIAPIDTKVSILNQSQGRNQFLFKELNSPINRSTSKKFNNSLAINNNEP